ncbi:MAG: cytochrome c biogenesis protein CcsA [Fuerstiella sp.]
MAFLSKVHLSCFLLSYLVAFGVELFQLVRQRTGTSRSLLMVFTAAGLIAHSAYLITRSLKSGLPPLVGSSHDWLLVLAWVGGVLYLLALAIGERITLGLFLLPVMLGLIVLAMFVDDSAEVAERQIAAHRWGMLHASTLAIGMACVAAATISALMYLLQHQKLRGRRSRLHRLQLPSLEQLTATNRWLVFGTVVMLTIGLVTGFILAVSDSTEVFDWSDPIVAGTTIVWGIMVVTMFWLLTRREQTGRQVARLTLLAGGFLLLTIFGLMLLSGGVHGSDAAPVANTSVIHSAEEDSRSSAHS